MIRVCRRSGAFTLLEALLATVVLALSAAAVSQAIVAGQMQTYASLHDLRALSAAEALLDEVLSLPYADPDGESVAGPESGENDRADFDNADDFHGFEEEASEIADQAGELYPDLYQGFSRSVTAAYGQMTHEGFEDPVPGLTVTVTTTEGTGREWVISRFIAQPPGGGS
jgi:Tfp pilus assembly protein PilV